MTMQFKVCTWIEEGKKVLVEISSQLPKESLKMGMKLTLPELVTLNDQYNQNELTDSERRRLYQYIMDSRLAVKVKPKRDRQVGRFSIRYK